MSDKIRITKITGKEFYTNFKKEDADALFAKLEEANEFQLKTLILTIPEKVIYFECLRASIESLNYGLTITMVAFNRAMLKNEICYKSVVLSVRKKLTRRIKKQLTSLGIKMPSSLVKTPVGGLEYSSKGQKGKQQ